MMRSPVGRGAGSGGSRVEGERDAVHAVAQAGRRRAVVEHMAEMAAAAAAVHFGADHPERRVGVGADRVVERFPEARPARMAVELGGRREQREVAAGARERAGPVLGVQRAAVRPLGAGFAQDRVLGGREPAMPFGVAERDLERGGLGRAGGRRGERAADQRAAAGGRQRRERGETGGAGEQQMSAGGHDGLLEAGPENMRPS